MLTRNEPYGTSLSIFQVELARDLVQNLLAHSEPVKQKSVLQQDLLVVLDSLKQVQGTMRAVLDEERRQYIEERAVM
jgi:hypothetical protein